MNQAVQIAPPRIKHNSVLMSVLFAMLCISCTTGRDIYSPTHSPSRPVPGVTSSRSIGFGSASARPDWVYMAMDGRYIVGSGQGNTISEAQAAAVLDVLAKIAQQLPQQVKSQQFASAGNRTTGRASVNSESVYLLSRSSQNHSTPLISFEPGRIQAYHAESLPLGQYLYFIKYEFPPTALQEILENYKRQSQQMRALVDSLTCLEGLNSVEQLLERYDALHRFSPDHRHDGIRDSILVQRAQGHVAGLLNGLEIVVSGSSDSTVCFDLAANGKRIKSLTEPIVKGSIDVQIQQIHRKADGYGWRVDYSLDRPAGRYRGIWIRLNFIDFLLEHHVDLGSSSGVSISPPISAESMNLQHVEFKEIRSNRWNGHITQVRAELIAHIREDAQAVRAEIILRNRFGGGSVTVPMVFDEIHRQGTKVILAGKTNVEISQRFIRSVHREVDVRIHYRMEEHNHYADFKGVSFEFVTK